MKGRFIVVEGIDGSGKTTLAARLADALAQARRRVLQTREPGGTALGERIRSVLLDARHAEMTPLTELFLYMASRAQLVDQVIHPALLSGIDVICDRYYYSTAAYQGAAGDIGVRTVLDLAEKTAGFVRPDTVLLLDMPPRAVLARKSAWNDRIERKGEPYQRKVRRCFLRMARRDPRRFRVIDASRNADAVFEDAWKAVHHAL